jgi:hypothetical protein
MYSRLALSHDLEAPDLSVPSLFFRHVPSPAAPGSPVAASTRCFTTGTGFVISEGLAAPIGVTRLNRVHLRYGPRLRHTEASWPELLPDARSGGYMANGSFHGELLSVHENKLVSLTHRIARIGIESARFIRVIRVIRG